MTRPRLGGTLFYTVIFLVSIGLIWTAYIKIINNSQKGGFINATVYNFSYYTSFSGYYHIDLILGIDNYTLPLSGNIYESAFSKIWDQYHVNKHLVVYFNPKNLFVAFEHRDNTMTLLLGGIFCTIFLVIGLLICVYWLFDSKFDKIFWRICCGIRELQPLKQIN